MERLVFKTTKEGELTLLLHRGGVPNAPLIYWIHGGSWCAGSAEEDEALISQIFAPLLSAGWALAAVNYRLTGENKSIRFDDQMEDILDGLCWLSERAEEFSIDPQRVVTAGGSAGGHLSLMLALASDMFRPQKPFRVILEIDLCGPVDLSDLSCYEGGHFREDAHRVVGLLVGESHQEHMLHMRRHASPLYYVNPQSPPVMIIHGTHDTIVPIVQSDRLFERLRVCGVPVVFCPVAGAEHSFAGFMEGQSTIPSYKACVCMACDWAADLAETAESRQGERHK